VDGLGRPVDGSVGLSMSFPFSFVFLIDFRRRALCPPMKTLFNAESQADTVTIYEIID
jgi:hypothetical protein